MPGEVEGAAVWGDCVILEEDGESFVEAQGHGHSGTSQECYHELISDIKMRIQACGLVDARQKQ